MPGSNGVRPRARTLLKAFGMKNEMDATKRRIVLIPAMGLSMLFAVQTVDAQPRWGRPDVPRSGACFYRDFNFRGDSFCVSAGEDASRLSKGMNDEISSIRTYGNAEVIVYSEDRFRGRSAVFTHDVRNLRTEGWNDRLSSIRIDRDRRGRADRRDDRRGRGLSRFEADRIIRGAYQDILDRQPDTPGRNLYRSRLIDDGWTEKQVREALRTSPEYRMKNQMTRPKAVVIVARAYSTVLNREPDAGSRGYVDKVLYQRWTQDDVERELRKSAEYRNGRR